MMRILLTTIFSSKLEQLDELDLENPTRELDFF